MNQHIMPVRTNVLVFVGLLALLMATVVAAYLPLEPLHLPIAMAIALAKGALIVLFFMHVKHSHRLTAIICVAAFLWLAIMLSLTLTDYLSRGWLDIPGK